MRLFKKTLSVGPNQQGFLFRDNKLEKVLDAGRYEIWDLRNRTKLICLPVNSRLLTVNNQEVLSKDNVALRFSFVLLYKIVDGETFLKQFELNRDLAYVLIEAEHRIATIAQLYLRNLIASLESEQLNEKRSELIDFQHEEMQRQVQGLGIRIEQAQLKDLTFPKAIQDLFARQLEAKIRSKADLENARTTVATARALKNAAELVKGDENVKFYQLLETMTKIAGKGKHTFLMGDVMQMVKK